MIFKKVPSFFILPGLYFISGLILIFLYEKVELHLYLNQFNSSILDTFFKYFTHIGDGLTVAILILIFALIHYKNFLPIFLVGISGFLFTGLLAQFFKKVVFPEVVRPGKLIDNNLLHLIDGVSLNHSFSFPSGHSTSTFALCLFLAIFLKKYKAAPIILGGIAVLGAYSRIYLSQHFMEDTLAGLFLGTFGFILIYWVYSKYTFKSFFRSMKED